MFGVVVIPRHSIMVQEGKELGLVLFKALLVAAREIRLKFPITRLSEDCLLYTSDAADE